MFHLYNSKAANFSRFLALCKSTKQLKSLKSLLIVDGLIQDELLLGQFWNSCFQLGAFDLAISGFTSVKTPSLFLQNLVIRGLCNHRLYENLLSLYQKCRNSGCPSNDFTFPFVIKACSALGDFRTGKELHCVILRTGYEQNVVIQTALADFYAKHGYMETAHKLFDRIPEPDLVSWNALLAGYSLNGFDQKVFEVFKHILAVGLRPNSSTLASVIPVCTRSGCFSIVKSLHGFVLKSGYFADANLVPALVSMHAGDGHLSAARKLFDGEPKRNVALWNAMISAYTQSKIPFQALDIFREMLRTDVQPDYITFVSIIPSCEITGDIRYGESIHACATKHISENRVSVFTAIVSMYAKLGDVFKAKFLFDRMPNKNLLSWNVMVSGYVHNALWDASLATFCEMQLAGFSPDAVSMVSSISACSKLEAVLLGKSIHAFSIRKGIDSNLNVANAFMAFYTDCNHLTSSFKLFHKMDSRTAVTWNTLISGCVHNGEVEKAVELLLQMQEQGMAFDSVTLISILPICCEIESFGLGMSLHCYAIKNGFASDASLGNALISMYSKCGDLEAGRLVFEAIPRSVVSWNAMITVYRNHNLVSEVFTLFNRMTEEDQRPNSITLLNIVPICCSERQGKSIHAFAIRTGSLQDAPLLTSLIFMYASFENMKSSRKLFEMEKEKDTSLWNAIIYAHIQTKSSGKAVGFFSDMLRMGIQPDNITLLSLISACAELNNQSLAHSIMAYMVHRGFHKDTVILNALIDLYGKFGNISTAEKLFDGLLEKDTISWSVMINGYNLQGNGKAALRLFSIMQSLGVKPNEFTFSSVLSACSHGGLVEDGWMVFKSMVEHGIAPKMEHYAGMVNLLGRTGHLNEAYDIIKKLLPWKPSISLLETLLGACRVHGNLEIGEKVGTMLSELYPESAGSYVMLSNMYAAAGRWTDADKVRSIIQGKGLRKVPGFSLLLSDGPNEEC